MQNLEQYAALQKLNKATQLTQAKRAAAPSKQYAEFRAKYKYDPAGFIQDAFIWPDKQRPAPYQLEIGTNLIEYQREAVRGLHGLGKTTIAAWLVHWFALTRDIDSDWKLPTTASVWRQLNKYLWPEIHKWARRLKWELIGRPPYDNRTELQVLNLKLTTGEAFAVASDSPGNIEGAHADCIFYIFDEAKLIAASIFDAAEGAFSGAGQDTDNEALALAISTPGETSGRFYDIHRKAPGLEDWHTRHVTLQEAVKAGRVSLEWANNRKKLWGEESAAYQNRVLGEFADSDESAVIPLSWVEKAIERWNKIDGAVYEDAESGYGVDVARFGEDKTVICKVTGDVCEWLQYSSRKSTMQTAGKVANILGSDYDSPIAIDTIGVGGGVYDRLGELGYNVVSVNVQEATDLTDSSGENKFNSLRSAVWWSIREALDPDGKEPLALPPDDTLVGDLTAPTWGFTSRGAIVVESKDDIKKRLNRSPDAADALALALYALAFPNWTGAW